MAGFGQQPQQDVQQQETHISEILGRMGLQRDVHITGMQAGQMFGLLCESFQTALTGQQARVEQMAVNLQAEHAGVVNKMREDVDNSLRHNAQVAGEQIAQLKAELQKAVDEATNQVGLDVINANDATQIQIDATGPES